MNKNKHFVRDQIKSKFMETTLPVLKAWMKQLYVPSGQAFSKSSCPQAYPMCIPLSATVGGLLWEPESHPPNPDLSIFPSKGVKAFYKVGQSRP